MTRLYLLGLVILFSLSVFAQDCEVNSDCFLEESDCEEESLEMYDTGDYQQAYEFSECADNGVTCTKFNQVCVTDVEENYSCLDVSDACAAALESCSCGESTGPTTPFESTTGTSETDAPVTDAPATDAPATDAPDTDTTAATEGTAAGPDTEGTTAEPDTEGTDAPTSGTEGPTDTEETEAPGTEGTEQPSGEDAKPVSGGDWHRYCCRWAIDGKCDKNPKFMRPLCQKSCGTKDCKAEDALSCKVSVSATPENCDSYKTTVAPMPSPYRKRKARKHFKQ